VGGVDPGGIDQSRVDRGSVDQALEALRRVSDLDRVEIRKHVERNFSRDRMVERYIAVYEEVLRMNKSKAAGASPLYDERPWGSFQVLDEAAGYKVKRIVVLPGKRLSYQKHAKRSEHWMVVAGAGRVTLDGRGSPVATGETVDVPVGTAHRIENTGTRNL